MKPANQLYCYACLLSVFILVTVVWSVYGQITQEVPPSSSINPVGSGARAVGMGGAFIAVADDPTAASWNPAGLVIQDRAGFFIVGDYFYREDKYVSMAHPESSHTDSFSTADLNYASVVLPPKRFGPKDPNIPGETGRQLNRVVFSVNYQRLFEMSKRSDFTYSYQDIDYTQEIHYQQTGAISAIAPACGVQLGDFFAVGTTLNFWTDKLWTNGWEEEYHSIGERIFGSQTTSTETSIHDDFSFSGFNMNFGLLYRPDWQPAFTLGAVLKTPFSANIEHNSLYTHSETTPGYEPIAVTFTEDLELDMPISYGIGLATRFNDKFLMAIDVYRTEWSDFVLRYSNGNETNPLTGESINDARLNDTFQVRLGSEYTFSQKPGQNISLRCGVFYDPEPAHDDIIDFYGGAIGVGVQRENWFLDVAYQYRFADNVPESDFSETDVLQHTLLLAIGYRFK